MRTWFITGVSRGLGLAIAQAALAEGDTVIGTVRDKAPDLASGPGKLHIVTLDVADGDAAEGAVRQAFARAGKIDVIVNNAGYGLLGALEKATDADVRRLFEVDVFAPFRIIRAALPHLRAQASGHIINITSIAGRAPLAASALYAAAKYALEGMSASSRAGSSPVRRQGDRGGAGRVPDRFPVQPFDPQKRGGGRRLRRQRRPHRCPRFDANGRQADRRSGSRRAGDPRSGAGRCSRRSTFFWERTRCDARARRSMP